MLVCRIRVKDLCCTGREGWQLSLFSLFCLEFHVLEFLGFHALFKGVLVESSHHLAIYSIYAGRTSSVISLFVISDPRFGVSVLIGYICVTVLFAFLLFLP